MAYEILVNHIRRNDYSPWTLEASFNFFASCTCTFECWPYIQINEQYNDHNKHIKKLNVN